MTRKRGRKKRRVDWDSIEPLYRAGELSNREIARQYERDHVHSQTWSLTVTEGAIRKHAKKKKWQRNIADKVRERVREKLVRNQVRTANQTELSEEELIEAAAEKPVAVRMLQRGRAQELAETGDRLQRILNTAIDVAESPPVPSSDQEGEQEKKLSLYSLVGIYGKLVAARSKLQEMESDAFGLSQKDDTGPRRIRVTHIKEHNN